MKKRIISLVFAILLLCSVSITVSAASRENVGTSGNCTYGAYSYCYPNQVNCILEYLSSTDDWTNYRFQVKVLYFYTQPQNGSVYNWVQSGNTQRIANVYRSYDSNVIDSVSPAFYVNGNCVLEYSVSVN